MATKNINAEKIQGNLAITSVSATTYYGLPIDIRVTGGTYNAGTATFTNNTGGTFTVTGFSTGGGSTFTGGTVTGPTNFTAGLTANTISATTYFNLPIDVYVTGGTYDAGTATFTNNTGGTFSVAGFSTGGGGSFTGGTVTGPTNFTNGLSANTISATTYSNLPTDIRITGGTYSSGTTTLTLTNNTGGTVSVGGFASGITASQATGAFGITIDGLGGVISSGQKGYVYVPYNGVITGWSIFSDVVGSCVVDVWKDTYGNFPPTSGDSITGNEKPTLVSQTSNRDLILSSWTTTISIGDIIGFNVEASPTGVTRVNVIINVNKT